MYKGKSCFSFITHLLVEPLRSMPERAPICFPTLAVTELRLRPTDPSAPVIKCHLMSLLRPLVG